MFCMAVHYFCIKTAQERAGRPRQGMPAKVAAATLGAMCMCMALAVFASGILYMACGKDLHECPGLSEHVFPPGHHHRHGPPGHHHRHGIAMMGGDWEGDQVHPGFDVPTHGNPLPKCQACLASGFDYCIHEDRCTKRATYTCKGPHDHITGDKEFALHGNPHTKHSMICPASEVKVDQNLGPPRPEDVARLLEAHFMSGKSGGAVLATSKFSAVAESKNKEIVGEHKPCKMKKHLLAFASAVKSLLGTKQTAEKTAILVV